MPDDERQAAAVLDSKASGDGARFAAFISYSHADEKIADWLHGRLEAYRVPPALGRSTRLGKVFRDRVELSAAHDLGGEIRRALEASDALIVLCSPRAATSRYVEEEIRFFKELGRGDRIFAAIIDGEPHAAGKPGRTAAEECFPRALLYRVDETGRLIDEPETTEPIAADVREGRDGRENGSLKLIAGLLGVGLDELVQRERQAERARRRRTQLVAAVMGALALGAAAAGGWAWWQQGVAEARRVEADEQRNLAQASEKTALQRQAEAVAAREAETKARGAAEDAEQRAILERDGALEANSELLVGFGRERLKEGDAAGAVAHALEALSVLTGATQQKDRQAAQALLRDGLVRDPFRAALRGHTERITDVGKMPDANLLWSTSRDGSLRLWDAGSGIQVREYAILGALKQSDLMGGAFRSVTGGLERAVYDPETKRFAVFGEYQIVDIDAVTGQARLITADRAWTSMVSVGKWHFAFNSTDERLYRLVFRTQGMTLTPVTGDICPGGNVREWCRIFGDGEVLLTRWTDPGMGTDTGEVARCIEIDPASGEISTHAANPGVFREGVRAAVMLAGRRGLFIDSEAGAVATLNGCAFEKAPSDWPEYGPELRISETFQIGPDATFSGTSRPDLGYMAVLDPDNGVSGLSIRHPKRVGAAVQQGPLAAVGYVDGTVEMFRLNESDTDDAGDEIPFARYLPSECREGSFGEQLARLGSNCEVSSIRFLDASRIAIGYLDGSIDIIDTNALDLSRIEVSGSIVAARFSGENLFIATRGADDCTIRFFKYAGGATTGAETGSTSLACSLAQVARSSAEKVKGGANDAYGVFSGDGASFLLRYQFNEYMKGGYWFVRTNGVDATTPLSGAAAQSTGKSCTTQDYWGDFNRPNPRQVTVCIRLPMPVFVAASNAFAAMDTGLALHFWSAADGRRLSVERDPLFYSLAATRSLYSGFGSSIDEMIDRGGYAQPKFNAHDLRTFAAHFGATGNRTATWFRTPYTGAYEIIGEGGPDSGSNVDCVFFSSDGARVFLPVTDALYGWDTSTGKLVSDLDLGFYLWGCEPVSGSGLVAAHGGDGDMAFVDPRAGALLFQTRSTAWNNMHAAGLRGGQYQALVERSVTDGPGSFFIATLSVPFGPDMPTWAGLVARRGLRDEERTAAFRAPVASAAAGQGCFDAWEWMLDPNRQPGKPTITMLFDLPKGQSQGIAAAWVDCVAKTKIDELTPAQEFRVGLMEAMMARALRGDSLTRAVARFQGAAKRGYAPGLLAEALLYLNVRDRTPQDLRRAFTLASSAAATSVEARMVKGMAMMEMLWADPAEAERRGITPRTTGDEIAVAACGGSAIANVLMVEAIRTQVARSFALGPQQPRAREVWLDYRYPEGCPIAVTDKAMPPHERMVAQALAHAIYAERAFPEATVGSNSVVEIRATLARALPVSTVLKVAEMVPDLR